MTNQDVSATIFDKLASSKETPLITASPPNVYVAAFLASVPTAFLREVLDLIFKAYRDAFNHCEQAFEENEAHDARPIYRRGLMEQDLRSLAIRHGFQGRSVANSTKSNYHTEVTIAGVVITENTLTSPLEMVKEAQFRSGLALEYQLPLKLFGNEEARSNSDQSLYAVIITGQNREKPALPAFVEVVFPNQDCTHYMGRLNLIAHLEEMGVTHAGATTNIPAPKVAAKEGTKRGIAKGSP